MNQLHPKFVKALEKENGKLRSLDDDTSAFKVSFVSIGFDGRMQSIIKVQKAFKKYHKTGTSLIGNDGLYISLNT